MQDIKKELIVLVILWFVFLLASVVHVTLEINKKVQEREKAIQKIMKQEVKELEELSKLRALTKEESKSSTEQQEQQPDEKRKERTERKDRPKQKPNSRNAETVKHTFESVLFTFYTANCEGCSGFTRWGEYDVRNTVYYNGMRIIATDPNVIPPYSIVEFELEGQRMTAIALDTGGAIKGTRIDLLVKSESKAIRLGRQYIDVHIKRWGKGN